MTEMKHKLKNMEVTLGTMISEVATANIVRIFKTTGYEFVIVDCEHGYFDFSQLANIISVGNGFDISVIVRIPAIERGYIAKILDMGGDGLLAPMVNTAEDAKRVVQLAKYPPKGERGISTTRAHTNYNPPPLDQYVEIANQNTVVFVQIETMQGIENADEIAAVDGIDGIIVGPNDLAVNLGWPGHLETPEMDEAIGRVVKAAKKANKSCGIIDSHISFLKKWRENGMNIFSCSSEIGMMMKMAKENHTLFFEEGECGR